MKLTQQQKGIAFALLAPLLYAFKSVAIKSTPPIKVEQVVFLRYFFDFLILSPFFLKTGKALASKKIPLHVLRAGIIVFSSCCSVYGIKNLKLVDALLLENTMPLFIPFVLWVWHRQKITPFSWAMLFVGFFSLFFLLKPQLDILHLASFASLATGLASAITTVTIKTLSKTESTIAILFYYNICAGCFAFLFCTFTWEGLPYIPSIYWIPLVLNSLFGLLFQYIIIQAYSLISPHIVGSFAYLGLFFSAVFGWFLWQEALDAFQIFGGLLLIIASLLMILQKKKENVSEKESLVSGDE